MKTDRIPSRGRAPLFLGVSAACAAVLVSGCMSSPTYGTDKTANVQLLDDLTSIVSTSALTGANRGAEIAYKPRPELVRPASLEVLPEPQQELASAGNPAWPESPEQRRARLRAEATENQDNPFYRSPINSAGYGTGASDDGKELTPEQRAELQRQRIESQQGQATQRKYLSEPPLDYRVPEATAAANDLGEDEWKKERRAKRATGKSSWRDYIPGL